MKLNITMAMYRIATLLYFRPVIGRSIQLTLLLTPACYFCEQYVPEPLRGTVDVVGGRRGGILALVRVNTQTNTGNRDTGYSIVCTMLGNTPVFTHLFTAVCTS